MIKNLFKNILLASHPVGSIYITTDGSFDPHESWGGSWELLEDRFLVGAGNTYTLGASGGEAEHTLTVDECQVTDMTASITQPMVERLL